MNDSQKEKKYKKTLYICLLIYTLSIILLYLTFAYTFSFTSHIEQIPFQQNIWIKENEREIGKQNYRFAMIDDILKNHLKDEMSKEEVDHLLGKPDDQSNKHYFYHLGSNEGIFGISFLYIYYNERDEIKKIELRND